MIDLPIFDQTDFAQSEAYSSAYPLDDVTSALEDVHADLPVDMYFKLNGGN